MGSAWDPTHQCIPWSGSEHCDDGKLCGDDDYEYECLWESDRFSCAPGDLSGKIGSLTPGEVIDQIAPEISLLTSLIPETDALTNKIMTITCSPGNEKRPKFVACAPIEEYDEDSCTDCWEAICLGNSFENLLPQCGEFDPFENCEEEEFFEVVLMQGVRYRVDEEEQEEDLLEVCTP